MNGNGNGSEVLGEYPAANHKRYISDLDDEALYYTSYQEAESSYADNRMARIRAAMFPELADDFRDEPQNNGRHSAHMTSRSSIVHRLAEPSQMVKTAIVELLNVQEGADLSTRSIPELIRLLCDNDPKIASRAAQKVYLLSKEDRTICSNPQLIEALMAASRSDNLEVQRDAMGALAHISDTAEGRLLLFRSGGIAELIRMLHSPHEVVVHYAVTTLHNLLLHVEAAKEQARALGGLEALTALLQHKTNHRLLALVADSIYFLLLDNPHSKLLFHSLDGARTLVAFLSRYAEYPKLTYTVVRCIRSLSVAPESKAALISFGALQSLYGALQRAVGHDDRAALAILVSMRNLSDAATNEENLAPLLVYLLNVAQNGDEASASCACGILSNLTCNNMRNKETVCASQGVQALVTALERFMTTEDITEPALCALRHCTARHSFAEQAQNDLRLSQAFPLLLSLLATLRAPVVKAALGVIRNSALLPANLISLTQEATDDGQTVVSLSVEVLTRAYEALKKDPTSETDGVPMWGLVEGAVAALHQLANHPQVAQSLFNDRMLLELVVDLLAREDVANNEDELLQRELLGLLYQLSKVPEGARAVAATNVQPLLEDAKLSQHKSVSTYASGVLRNLDADRPFRDELELEAAATHHHRWQRDGIEPELFGEMYQSPGLERIEQNFPLPHNNSSWFDTDL